MFPHRHRNPFSVELHHYLFCRDSPRRLTPSPSELIRSSLEFGDASSQDSSTGPKRFDSALASSSHVSTAPEPYKVSRQPQPGTPQDYRQHSTLPAFNHGPSQASAAFAPDTSAIGGPPSVSSDTSQTPAVHVSSEPFTSVTGDVTPSSVLRRSSGHDVIIPSTGAGENEA